MSKSKTYTTSELVRHFNISVVFSLTLIVKHKLKPAKTGQHNAKYDTTMTRLFSRWKSIIRVSLNHRKTTYAITKDAIIDQLKPQIQEQIATIEL